MTHHHRNRTASTKIPLRDWHAEFPARHRRFRRAAVPVVFGKPTAEQIAEYRKASAEWSAFLDSETDSDTPTEPQQ